MEPITSTVPGLTLVPCPHSSPGLFSSLTQRVLFFLRHKKRERARTLKVSTKEPQTPKSHFRHPFAVVSPSLSPSRPLENRRSRHSPVPGERKKSINQTRPFPEVGIWYHHAARRGLFQPSQPSPSKSKPSPVHATV